MTTTNTSPLAPTAGRDVWAPVPIGIHPATGEAVTVTLASSPLVVTGPDRARSDVARLAVAAAALDPTARLIVFDGQAGLDWHPFVLIAQRCGAGTEDEVVEDLAQVLNATAADLKRRHDHLTNVEPVDRTAVARALAGVDASMAPVVIAINDVDRYTAHATWGADIARCLGRILESGPALGLSLVLTMTGAARPGPWDLALAGIRVVFDGITRDTATVHDATGATAARVRAQRLDHDTLAGLVDEARRARRAAIGGGCR